MEKVLARQAGEDAIHVATYYLPHSHKALIYKIGGRNIFTE